MDLNLEDVLYTVVLMMPSLFTLDRQEITSLYEQGDIPDNGIILWL